MVSHAKKSLMGRILYNWGSAMRDPASSLKEFAMRLRTTGRHRKQEVTPP